MNHYTSGITISFSASRQVRGRILLSTRTNRAGNIHANVPMKDVWLGVEHIAEIICKTYIDPLPRYDSLLSHRSNPIKEIIPDDWTQCNRCWLLCPPENRYCSLCTQEMAVPIRPLPDWAAFMRSKTSETQQPRLKRHSTATRRMELFARSLQRANEDR